MKLDLYETHDRYQHFTKQNFDIGECCQDLIDQKPFGEHPFYIYAHARTDDDGVTKRMIWQPRLTRPEPETNSMLFKAYPGTDQIKIIWMIPAKELWPQYNRGLVTESAMVMQSIFDYKNNRQKLRERESDDLSDEQIKKVYEELSMKAKAKQASAAASLTS